jgi:hypothetical protein
MNLSKSKYCTGVQCPKMLWMKKNMPEQFNQAVMNEDILTTGNKVGDLAMQYFGEFIEIPFDLGINGMLDKTQELLKENIPVICEATFQYNGDLCMTDILRKVGDSYEIIEVKSSTECKDIYLHDMAFQYYILSQNGLNISKVCLMHINNQYVRQGELNIQELFTLEDHTNEILTMQNGIETVIAHIKEVASQKDEPEIKISMQCDTPYECGYKGWCWRDIPENSVFNVRRLTAKKKWEFYNNGIASFDDLMSSQERLNENQRQQIVWEVADKEPYYNKELIKEFLDTLSFPIYHLDFETFQEAIPPWDGCRPYMQIPSQYSLHIEHADDRLEHREFLGDGETDPRRALAEQLVADIPLGACSMAYNATFEMGVIRDLGEMYPDLKSHLQDIHNNMHDLMIPFCNHSYYAKDLKGSYSIKYVLPSLCGTPPELDYKQLDLVHNGGEAMAIYPKLASMNEQEKERTRQALLNYCKLDTLAMVKVLEKLRQAIK